LAFIELPSWLRGSRPYVLEARTDEIHEGIHQRRLVCNLGAGPIDAKGTAWDYLTHLERHSRSNNGVKPLFSGSG